MSLSETYKQYGLRVFSRGGKALLRKIGFQAESFFLLRYIIDPEQLKQKGDALDFSDVRSLTLADLTGSDAFSIEKKALFKSRLESNDYSCYGIKKNDILIYSTWISWKSMGYPGYFEKVDNLRTNEALLEDSYCDPRYRGKGIHYKMNIFRIQQILDSGRTEVLALVLRENLPALRVQLKSGFRMEKKIAFRRFGRWKRINETLLQ